MLAEVVVAVTRLLKAALGALFLCTFSCIASVLPSDRADVMYHSYSGGGVSIDGPAVMLRSKVAQDFSVAGYYYIDTVSGASIDVVATASAYSEERTEKHLGVDYLAGNSLISTNFSTSDENDYHAKTITFGISHDTFGGLTTLNLQTGLGDDEVGKNGDINFKEQVRRYNYKLGLTQILTTNWIAALNIQFDLDEGFLNNPYRQVRFKDPTAALGYSYQAEIYPRTRNSSAVSLVNKYYLPYRAAIGLSVRHYQDSWDISANDVELEYVHPLGKDWTFEGKVRYYQQTEASFYKDLFEYANELNFMARDKELSDFSNVTAGLGVSYKLPSYGIFSRQLQPEMTVQWDHIIFNYNNFRNVTDRTSAAGAEPLYQLDANVVRAFVSLYF